MNLCYTKHPLRDCLWFEALRDTARQTVVHDYQPSDVRIPGQITGAVNAQIRRQTKSGPGDGDSMVFLTDVSGTSIVGIGDTLNESQQG